MDTLTVTCAQGFPAPAARVEIFVSDPEALQSTGVDPVTVSVLAGNAPALPVVAGGTPVLPLFAVLRGASYAYDASSLRIKWEEIPSTYWISPGEYTIDLGLEVLPNSGAFDNYNHTQRVNLTILPNGAAFDITSLASINFGQFKLDAG